MTAAQAVETIPAGQTTDTAQPDWAPLVEKIRVKDPDGMEELYRIFSRGIRFYLCKQLGPQDLEDRLHDTFLVVAQAIQRGELREPGRLMGYVRTIVRRIVAAQIEENMHCRRQRYDLDWGFSVEDAASNPEQAAIRLQNEQIVARVLQSIAPRDREILIRFYVHEETAEQICADMGLTETQFRLMKSRAKSRFGNLGRKKVTRRLVRFW